jgi:hypothetical protein
MMAPELRARFLRRAQRDAVGGERLGQPAELVGDAGRGRDRAAGEPEFVGVGSGIAGCLSPGRLMLPEDRKERAKAGSGGESAAAAGRSVALRDIAQASVLRFHPMRRRSDQAEILEMCAHDIACHAERFGGLDLVRRATTKVSVTVNADQPVEQCIVGRPLAAVSTSGRTMPRGPPARRSPAR